MPKKPLPSTDSALVPHPDSRMACATVTDTGTPVAARTCRPRSAAHRMKASREAGDAELNEHHGRAGRPPGQATNASETSAPPSLGTQSHREVPPTDSPRSWQEMFSASPGPTVPSGGSWVDALARRLSPNGTFAVGPEAAHVPGGAMGRTT